LWTLGSAVGPVHTMEGNRTGYRALAVMIRAAKAGRLTEKS